jgi:hypothetical protein
MVFGFPSIENFSRERINPIESASLSNATTIPAAGRILASADPSFALELLGSKLSQVAA